MAEIQETRTFDEQPDDGDKTVEVQETRTVEQTVEPTEGGGEDDSASE